MYSFCYISKYCRLFILKNWLPILKLKCDFCFRTLYTGSKTAKVQVPSTFSDYPRDSYQNDEISKWYEQKTAKSLVCRLETFTLHSFSNHHDAESFLKNTFNENSTNQENYGLTKNHITNKVHAFVALLFRPLIINNLAAKYQKGHTQGDIIPQFLVKPKYDGKGRVKKWEFMCKICENYREFCILEMEKFNHKVIKNFLFEGVQQMRAHQKSQAHQEACHWIEYRAAKEEGKSKLSASSTTTRKAPKQLLLTKFVTGKSLN